MEQQGDTATEEGGAPDSIAKPGGAKRPGSISPRPLEEVSPSPSRARSPTRTIDSSPDGPEDFKEQLRQVSDVALQADSLLLRAWQESTHYLCEIQQRELMGIKELPLRWGGRGGGAGQLVCVRGGRWGGERGEAGEGKGPGGGGQGQGGRGKGGRGEGKGGGERGGGGGGYSASLSLGPPAPPPPLPCLPPPATCSAWLLTVSRPRCTSASWTPGSRTAGGCLSWMTQSTYSRSST